MPYTVKVSKTFSHSFTETYKGAYLSIKAMKGKILLNDPDSKHLEAQMDKKLYGKYLGDRSRLEIDFISEPNDETTLSITAYPVNPIGQKLMFGARKGVIARVLESLYAEMEQRLIEDYE